MTEGTEATPMTKAEQVAQAGTEDAEWETVDEWREDPIDPTDRRREHDTTERLRVPGGWLYYREIYRCLSTQPGTVIRTHMVFVPDAARTAEGDR